MGNKLYVGNLPYSVRDGDLEQAFGQFGAVASAKVMMERDTGRSKGFGFVEMGSDAEAQSAINGLNGQPLGGRNLVVNEARPMEARPPPQRRWLWWRRLRRRQPRRRWRWWFPQPLRWRWPQRWWRWLWWRWLWWWSRRRRPRWLRWWQQLLITLLCATKRLLMEPFFMRARGSPYRLRSCAWIRPCTRPCSCITRFKLS